MKRWLVLLCVLLASLGVSAMDLEWITRYNVSGPVENDMRKLIRRADGSYVSVGYLEAAGDLYVTVLDSSFNVVSSRRWDSVERRNEYLAGAVVDSAGDIYMLAGGTEYTNTSPIYLVKFDGLTLLTEWEKTITGTNGIPFSSYELAISGAGAAEYAYVVGASSVPMTRVHRFSKAGVEQAITSIPLDVSIRDVIAIPDTSFGGVAFVGSVDSKFYVGHVDSGGAVRLNQQCTALGNGQLNAVALNSLGRIYAVGYFYSNQDLSMVYQLPGGNLVQFSTSTYDGAQDIAQVSNSGFLINAAQSSNSVVVPFNGDTLGFGTPSTIAVSGRFAISADRSRFALLGTSVVTGATNLAGGVITTDNGYRAVESFGNSQFLMGTATGRIYKEHALYMGPYTTAAYRKRSIYSAIPDGSGGFYQVSYVDSTQPSLVQRINGAGVVLWSRNLSLPFVQGESFIHLARMSNGDIAALGRSTLSGLATARLTPSGTITLIKRIELPGNFFHSGFALDSADRVVVHGQTDTNQATMHRMNLDGTGLQTLPGPTNADFGFYSYAPGLNGEFYMLAGGSALNTTVYRFDANGGILHSAVVADANQTAILKVDSAGRSAVIGRLGGTTVLTVRNATFGQIYTVSDASITQRHLAFGANGELRLVCADSALQIRGYNAAGATMWTTAVPASVNFVADLDVNPADGRAYLTCQEGTTDNTAVTNVIRYLPNGVRSIQKRIAGVPGSGALGAGNTSFWAFGKVTTRYKSHESFTAKWTLP